MLSFEEITDEFHKKLTKIDWGTQTKRNQKLKCEKKKFTEETWASKAQKRNESEIENDDRKLWEDLSFIFEKLQNFKI